MTSGKRGIRKILHDIVKCFDDMYVIILVMDVITIIFILCNIFPHHNNRLDGKSLPLPPHTNGTQWGQAVMAKNIETYCTSNNPCSNAFCPEPFECVDIWNKYECR
jgi:hypothetical protein